MHNVRRIRIENGETVTVAGTAGKAGAEDKRGVAATFNQPAGIWGDGSDLYVADLSNYAIRRLTAPRTGSEPALTSITPARTSTGTTATFTISGSNFIPGETSIVVNGPGTRLAGINVGSSTSLDVAIDIARSGARTVRVVLSSGTSNPIAFEIGDRPDLTRTSFAIAGRGGFSTITAEQPGVPTAGYARIRAESGSQPPAGLTIYSYRNSGVLVSEAEVPANLPIQAGRISFDSTGATNTGIAVLNPNDVPVRISFTTVGPDGSQFRKDSIEIAPGQQLSRFLNEYPFWSVLTKNIQGTFSFAASAPVSVIALRGFVNERLGH